MSGFYLATLVVVVVTTSLASNLLATATLGPARTDALVRLRLGLRRSPRHLKRLVDAWVAGMLARRERQAAICALHQMDDRALRDIGLWRGRIDAALGGSQRASLRDSQIKPGRLP